MSTITLCNKDNNMQTFFVRDNRTRTEITEEDLGDPSLPQLDFISICNINGRNLRQNDQPGEIKIVVFLSSWLRF